MISKRDAYRGCLLGLAIGDAMGYPVDTKTWPQIQEDYGPYGLMGYDLRNGYAEISSHTQIAAFSCNGLLLGLTRGQLSGTMAPPVRYIALALAEWADLQTWKKGTGDPVECWISRSSRMDYRRCTEPGMLDVLTDGKTGTMEDHQSSLSGPGALMAAVSVGLFFDPGRMPRKEIQRLGAEAAALTHGDPAAFLSGAALAHIISRIVWDGEENIELLARETGAMLKKRFGREYHQAWTLSAKLRFVRHLARRRADALEKLGCGTALEVLAGSLYFCLTADGNVEQAIEEAARWCPAGAAVVGALLGAVRGEEGLPGAWREELECAGVLRELAEDMFRGCPMMKGSKVFDVEWDEKYGM